MKRREFITLLGGAATARPLAALAQQPQMPVVGLLGVRSEEDSPDLIAEFRAGLGATGFIEDRNVRIEFRWAEGHYDRFPALARELVAHRVAAIVTTSLAGGLAAKGLDLYDPNRFLDRRGSCSIRTGQQSQPTDRQCHRGGDTYQHPGAQAVAASARSGADSYADWCSRQPNESDH